MYIYICVYNIYILYIYVRMPRGLSVIYLSYHTGTFSCHIIIQIQGYFQKAFPQVAVKNQCQGTPGFKTLSATTTAPGCSRFSDLDEWSWGYI